MKEIKIISLVVMPGWPQGACDGGRIRRMFGLTSEGMVYEWWDEKGWKKIKMTDLDGVD